MIRANNILLFKLVDPICQSLLLIFLIYCMDSDTETSYQTVLDILVGWQILSAIANFILKPADSLKQQRISFLVTICVYLGLTMVILRGVTEKVILIKQANNLSLPLYASIAALGTMILCFWYYVICFKEIRSMLTSVTNESN